MNAWRIVCAALTGLLLLGDTGAQERKAVETKPVVAVKEGYHAYRDLLRCGKRLLGTYDNIDAACRAAEKFRSEKKERNVEVTVNTGGTYSLGVTPVAYRVYRNPCKGFYLTETVTSAEKAKELAAAIIKDRE